MKDRLERLTATATEVRKSMGDLMNKYSDDPDDVDPFAHLQGRTYVRNGAYTDLHAVATDVWDTLQSQGQLSYGDLMRVCPVASGRGGEILVSEYYLEFLREELVARDNEYLPEIEIEGGVTVDRDIALEGGYIEIEAANHGSYERVKATDKLKREVVNDVVDPAWDYSRTAGFGALDDTLERYASSIVREFVRFAEELPYGALEIERENKKKENYAGIIRRDIDRVFDEALPQLEHAGFRSSEKYAFVAPDILESTEAGTGTTVTRSTS